MAVNFLLLETIRTSMTTEDPTAVAAPQPVAINLPIGKTFRFDTRMASAPWRDIPLGAAEVFHGGGPFAAFFFGYSGNVELRIFVWIVASGRLHGVLPP